MEKKKVETEVKFAVKDIGVTLSQLCQLCTLRCTEYIRDSIYGVVGEPKKIRLRVENTFDSVKIEAIYKYLLNTDGGLKNEMEETIYAGSVLEDAQRAIQEEGQFVEENSYEKVRVIYDVDGAEIVLDIYPFGVWLEIEGSDVKIWEYAEKLGFSKEQAITSNADMLYLDWQKKHNLQEQWDVRFGLTGER